MYAKQFVSFMERHNISSPGQWERATNGRVSKSTITRGLKGEGKDIGVNTILELITPYGETLDQVFSMGEYSEESQEKNKIVEKIESTIDEVQNSPVIPQETAQDITVALEEAQQFINATPKAEECVACGVLREMIAMLNKELEAKNTWIKNSFKICMILLLIIFAMTIIDGVLIASLIQILNK